MSQQVSAILLAAGRSRRMGRIKSLLPLGDRPAIRRCLDALTTAGLKEIVVVLGYAAAEIEKVLAGLPLALARNPDPESDMAGSVRVGLDSLSPEADAVLVCLVDHPLVSAATLDILLQRNAAEPGFITIPTYRGKKGHPTLFPRSVIEELFSVPTLRHVIRQHQTRLRLVEVPDQGVVLDMDTPADYQIILGTWQEMEEGRRERVSS